MTRPPFPTPPLVFNVVLHERSALDVLAPMPPLAEADGDDDIDELPSEHAGN